MIASLHRRCWTISLALAAISVSAGFAAEESPEAKADYQTETLRGKVVYLAEALERHYGIETVPEARERILALETAEGELHPIAEDVRGRAFRRDERLRKRELELLVRRHRGAPIVQVIRVYAIEDDGKYELDYWCDICSIALFELKPCDCCQGPLELRARRVPE